MKKVKVTAAAPFSPFAKSAEFGVRPILQDLSAKGIWPRYRDPFANVGWDNTNAKYKGFVESLRDEGIAYLAHSVIAKDHPKCTDGTWMNVAPKGCKTPYLGVWRVDLVEVIDGELCLVFKEKLADCE